MKNLKEQMDAAAILYKDEMTLQAIADALSLNPIKVRKLLITAGVYESDTAKLVRQTFHSFRETQDYDGADINVDNADNEFVIGVTFRDLPERVIADAAF